MTQLALSKCLKSILAGVWVCGLIIYFAVVPMLGQTILLEYPESGYCFWPWLIFIWCTGIPCAAGLVFAWRMSTNIGDDRSFSVENAKLLRRIAILAAGDAAFFFVGNIVFLCLNMNHPAVVIFSLFVVFAAVAIAVAAAALSHLVMKAALMQAENDLTI